MIPIPDPDLRRVHATGMKTMMSIAIDKEQRNVMLLRSTEYYVRDPEANHDKNRDKNRNNPRCTHSYG